MKSILKAALAAAIAGIVVGRLLRKQKDSLVSKLNPLRDAEPTQPEPLRPEDMRVAQNAPF